MCTVSKVRQKADASYFKVKVSLSTLKLHGRGRKNVCGFSVRSTVIYETTRFSKHAVTQLVEALRYKPEGRGFDSRWCH